MSPAEFATGPVKAWIEPDRWAFLRAFPRRAFLLLAVAALSAALGYTLHPAFFVLMALALMRHAAAEASLRELFRDGMLHPAMVIEGARGLIATLVRLESDGRAQDAIVISRTPRRWTRQSPPWGGERAAMVIAGDPPRLTPLSPDFAVRDLTRARRAAERIPDAQWRALSAAVSQLDDVREGVHPVQLGVEPWYGRVRELERDGSLPLHLEASEQHAWCAGLPSVEEPNMVEAERKRVEQLRRDRCRHALALALLWVGALWLLGRLVIPPALRAPLFVFALLAAPFSLASFARDVRRARAYGRDLRGGRLLRFAGSLSTFDSLALDRDLALLARRGVFAPEPGVEHDLVLLKVSHELLHANGRWAPPGVTLHVSEVAAPPDDALKLALPKEFRNDSSETLDVARRRFTAAELGELARHAERLRRPGSLLSLSILFGATALLWYGGHDRLLPPHFLGLPLVLGMWLFAGQVFWRRWRLSARLRADAELGWVVTVDHGGAGASGDPELPARGVESLLHARLDWTVNRRPATWRRFGK